MKTSKLFLSLLLCSVTALSLYAKKDPTLMNVDGKDIKVSDFEYLYNKNNAQQAEPQSLESYLDLFINYRLKVADALNARLDTTTSFVSEFEKYRDDLARPYLEDKKVSEQLKREAYSHMQRNITVSHIMVSREEGKAVADSLYDLVVSGKANFEDLATNRSIDTRAAQQKGYLGAVSPGRFPYAFEEAAYNTPLGEISRPVNSGFGWHIIRVDSSEPSKGEVRTSHILLLTRGKSADEAARAKTLIDSLYNEAKSGADFADLAKRFSQDGSARQGGDLGWYGQGMMVQPFDSISFALPVGALSEPFLTPYGYHIIYKTDARDMKSYEEVEKDIESLISRDYRATLPLKAALAALAKRTGSMVNQSTLEVLDNIIDADTAAIVSQATVSAIAESTLPAFGVKGKEISMAEIKNFSIPAGLNKAQTKEALREAVNAAFDREIYQIAVADLEKQNTEFRNLINEYRDGILLFDISNIKVWDRASKDEAGQKAYFEAHRDKYTWETPKFKSYIIFAVNDSVLAEVKDFADRIPADVTDRDAITEMLTKRFGKKVKIERVIASRGENVITDYLGFEAAKPDVQSQRWPVYFAFRGKVIDAPEEVADVRGAVVSDYQQELEAAWLEELHKKYPVKVNKKVLKQLAK